MTDPQSLQDLRIPRDAAADRPADALRFEDVSVTYRSGRRERRVLAGISLAIRRGYTLALHG